METPTRRRAGKSAIHTCPGSLSLFQLALVELLAVILAIVGIVYGFRLAGVGQTEAWYLWGRGFSRLVQVWRARHLWHIRQVPPDDSG